MWRYLATAVIIVVLLRVAVGQLSGPATVLDDGRPRAPDYVAGWKLPDTPAPAPAAVPPAAAAPSQPMSPAMVNQQLDQLWARNDWAGVIALLEDQRSAPRPVLSPAILREKLYAAQVNAGKAVLQAGNLDAARQHFLKAMAVDPDRPEAPDAMKTAERAATP